MKNSTKFWSAIMLIVFILIQFNVIVIIAEIVSLIIVFSVYTIVSLHHLIVYEVEETSKKWNIYYWIIYLPILKFNNFLNNL